MTAPATPDDGQSPGTIRRRFDRVLLGLCLGGAVLGIAGCALGTLMPYRQPVAVALSALWWGIYLGGFGAAIGVIVAEFSGRTRGSRRPGPDDAGERAIGARHWEQYVPSRDFAAGPPAETQVVIELLRGEVAQLQARVCALEQRLQDVHS